MLREDIIGKELLSTDEKYYLTDHGFHQALVDENNKWLPRIIENIVYIELLRRGYSVKVGWVKNKEVDFIAKNKNNKIYIQVAYLLASDETIEREFTPLLNIPDKYDAYVKKRDLEETLRIMEIELPSECFDELLDKIDEELADNDTYWDIYGQTVEDAIYEYVEERGEN